MQTQRFAWPWKVMFDILLPIYLLFGICGGCQGQGNNTSPIKTSTDTVPPLIIQEQPRQRPVHQYGNYTLEKADESFIGSAQLGSMRYQIKEVFPGVLIHTRESNEKLNIRENTVLVEYYDTTTRKLKKRVDLEKITPYKKEKYEKISIGGLDSESMEIYSPDSNCIMPKLPKASYYYTRNWIKSISSNGYMCVGFELIKMAEPNIVAGWEQTLMILDPQGKELGRIPLDHDALSPIVTKDGKFLIFTSGGHNTDNPFEPCRESVTIFDLTVGEIVYNQTCDQKQSIGFLDPERSNGELISLITNPDYILPRIIYTVLTFDVNKREIRKINLVNTENSNLFLNSKTTADKHVLLKKLPFSLLKF